MTNVKGTTPKVGYIFDEATSTWQPLAGMASTTIPYVWTAKHTFTTDIVAKAGVNVFTKESNDSGADRDTVLGTPGHGTMAFIKQAADGTPINNIQFYDGTTSSWLSLTLVNFSTQSGATYTLTAADATKLVNLTSSSSTTVTVPANASVAFPIGTKIDIVQSGSGQVTIAAASNVTINSKNSWLKLNAQYSAATLIKTGTNTWLLIGDLKS